jgi:hypothetical protein
MGDKIYVSYYGFIDNTEKALSEIKTDTENKLASYQYELDQQKNSWLLSTPDLTWRQSSFANQVRHRIDVCGRKIKEARETLQELRTLQK